MTLRSVERAIAQKLGSRSANIIDVARQTTRTRTPRQRTLRLRDGRTVPIRESKLRTPAERVAAIERIAGSIKTDVIVDRSFYRNGRW